MASNKFDTGFQVIKIENLTLSYNTQYGETKVEGNILQIMNHLTQLIK